MDDDPNAVWDPVEPLPGVASRLENGQSLYAGQSLASSDGRFTLTYRSDGNLALRRTRGGQTLWESGTARGSVGKCTMRTDGNLVVYDACGVPVWTSGIPVPGVGGPPGILQDPLIAQQRALAAQRFAKLHTSGNLVIYDPQGYDYWETGTVRPLPMAPRVSEVTPKVEPAYANREGVPGTAGINGAHLVEIRGWLRRVDPQPNWPTRSVNGSGSTPLRWTPHHR